MGSPTRIIFPAGTLSWDEDRREMTYEETPTPVIYVATLGPWYLNDVPATATTPMKLLHMNTTTAVSQSSNGIRAGRVGEIVGMYVTSDASRVTGTLTLRANVGGVSTVFNGDAVQLGSSPTSRMSSIADPGAGVAIASGGDELGIDVVTSGWSPITADVAAWMLVRYTAM
jgi:hypothetical protein